MACGLWLVACDRLTDALWWLVRRRRSLADHGARLIENCKQDQIQHHIGDQYSDEYISIPGPGVCDHGR